ncbi:MAG: GNAT family N-acetyltransferase [Rhizobiales bacterium]|nr:GNAT family N-acetyltransferase [Hyphomicrobiales bacterium]
MTVDAPIRSHGLEAIPAIGSPPLQPDLTAGTTTRWVPAAQWPALLEAWSALAGAAHPNVFLNPAFALAARRIDAWPGLGAVAVEEDGRLVGLAPGRFRLKGTVFALWTHPYAPYGGPLVARGHEKPVLAAILAHLQAQGVAALDWPMLDDGSPLAVALTALATQSERRIDILDAHRRAALITADPPAPGKEMRRLGRRLAEQGAVAEVSTARGFGLDAATETFLALEAEGWKGRKGSALRASAETRRFFTEAMAGLAAGGQARIDLILLDGQAIAGAVVLSAGERAWYWKTAYAEAFARFSPGVMVTQAIAARLSADPAIRLVDSCAIADHPMIDRVWHDRLGITSRLIAVAPGRAGLRYRLALAVVSGRRAARSGAKALIARLRRGRAKAAG